jgi:hypothetical protein
VRVMDLQPGDLVTIPGVDRAVFITVPQDED